MSERHESGRIDRQLAGRAGRQGRPGSFQPILSLDDPLMDNMDRRGIVKAVATRLMPVAGQWVGRIALLCAQMRAERLHARMRNDLLSQDEHRGSSLAFSGKARVEPCCGHWQSAWPWLRWGCMRISRSSIVCWSPAQLVRVGSSTVGILDVVMVKRGDFVEQGEVLAQLKSVVESAVVEIYRAQSGSTTKIKAQEARVEFVRKRLERAKVLWGEADDVVRRLRRVGGRACACGA